MRIERFEDAEVWSLARALARDVYDLTRSDKFKTDYSFRDQMRRSAVSIMANIAEGFERRTTGELVQFMFIAKGSAGEVRSHLYLALDIGYLEQQKFDGLFQSCEKISKSLSGFIKYLRKKP